MFNLTGKTALITGASGGIGGAIAKALHSAGATVGLCGRNAAALHGLEEQLGERVHVFVKDLSFSRRSTQAWSCCEIPLAWGRSQACRAARRRGYLARIALVDLVLPTGSLRESAQCSGSPGGLSTLHTRN